MEIGGFYRVAGEKRGAREGGMKGKEEVLTTGTDGGARMGWDGMGGRKFYILIWTCFISVRLGLVRPSLRRPRPLVVPDYLAIGGALPKGEIT